MSEEATALAATLRACVREGDEYEAISRIGLRAAGMLERQAAQLAALRAGADTEDLHAVPARAAMDVVDIAGIIYDACFLPGEEEDGYVMPPFEDAVRDGLGGSDRALVAARTIARQFRDTGSEAAEIRRQALEEAALVADRMVSKISEHLSKVETPATTHPGSVGACDAAEIIARRIRALADKPAAGGADA